MRPYPSFRILFLVILLMSSHSNLAGTQSDVSASVGHSKETVVTIPAETSSTGMQLPVMPAARQEQPVKKPHLLKMEELAHIHHFHKERVKKMKRHHKKCWTLSKILLILCHIALLVIAYMHVTPH